MRPVKRRWSSLENNEDITTRTNLVRREVQMYASISRQRDRTGRSQSHCNDVTMGVLLDDDIKDFQSWSMARDPSYNVDNLLGSSLTVSMRLLHF